jgi:hypothetical protein
MATWYSNFNLGFYPQILGWTEFIQQPLGITRHFRIDVIICPAAAAEKSPFIVIPRGSILLPLENPPALTSKQLQI